ncbi:hypothetical protein [Streptomyces sp. NBC_01276]|uniref:hypothetical protein n=1 Tax=Streptomyces sp. NBC_01276 TaxID=2903808 RepID=UPI00352F2B2B
MSAVEGGTPLAADWLDRLWEYADLAPAPAVRRERSGGPTCTAVDPTMVFPEPQELTPVEREAPRVCVGCLVRDLGLAVVSVFNLYWAVAKAGL